MVNAEVAPSSLNEGRQAPRKPQMASTYVDQDIKTWKEGGDASPTADKLSTFSRFHAASALFCFTELTDRVQKIGPCHEWRPWSASVTVKTRTLMV
jgi:hypothetical protein